MSQRAIEVLGEDQCWDLVRQESIARFVFQDQEGPAALPINYGVAGTDVVFRTDARSHFREVMKNRVAIEVDATDQQSGAGWSVLLRGTAREVPLDEVPHLLKQMGDTLPHPWAEGVHNIWIAVTPSKITGRQLTLPWIAALF